MGRSMLTCRHSDRDSIKSALTSGNVGCDGCDGIRGCRHNTPEPRSGGPETSPVQGAVKDRESAERTPAEISSVGDGVIVRLPAELPPVTPRVASALLAILVELTDVPVLDRPEEGDNR
jgi:hypothetical protein